MAEQIYKCHQCGHEWPASGATPGPAECPSCGSGPPFAPVMTGLESHGTSSTRLTLSTGIQRTLDALRLTVVGVLLGIGLTVGLSVGFGVGGCVGAVVGPVSGVAVVTLLVLAFRWRRSRELLAGFADWALRR